MLLKSAKIRLIFERFCSSITLLFLTCKQTNRHFRLECRIRIKKKIDWNLITFVLTFLEFLSVIFTNPLWNEISDLSSSSVEKCLVKNIWCWWRRWRSRSKSTWLRWILISKSGSFQVNLLWNVCDFTADSCYHYLLCKFFDGYQNLSRVMDQSLFTTTLLWALM